MSEHLNDAHPNIGIAQTASGHAAPTVGANGIAPKKVRAGHEFEAAARARGTEIWRIHDCSICGYPCGFLFNRDPQYPVLYDSGCNCTWGGMHPQTWDDVARQYNLQDNADVIAKYDAFWGFASHAEIPQ